MVKFCLCYELSWLGNVEGGSGWVSGVNGLLRSSSSTELRALQDQVHMSDFLID